MQSFILSQNNTHACFLSATDDSWCTQDEFLDNITTAHFATTELIFEWAIRPRLVIIILTLACTSGWQLASLVTKAQHSQQNYRQHTLYSRLTHKFIFIKWNSCHHSIISFFYCLSNYFTSRIFSKSWPLCLGWFLSASHFIPPSPLVKINTY